MVKRTIINYTFYLLLFVVGPIQALDEPDLLPPKQAFRVSTEFNKADHLLLSWDIAEGYYLYRDKFRFVSETDGVTLGEPVLPAGKIKHDEFFGEVETYRGKIGIKLPIIRKNEALADFVLQITSQGCADIGVCYPPYKQTLTIRFPSGGDGFVANRGLDALSELTKGFNNLGFDLFQEELLPPDQAFHFVADVKDSDTLRVSWQIAEGYYLYREKFKFSSKNETDTKIGPYNVPHGKSKQDEAFGQVEVFYDQIGFDLPLIRNRIEPIQIQLTAHYQGCAERGVCYPPMQKTVALNLPASAYTAISVVSSPNQSDVMSEQDQIASDLKRDTLWLTLLSFLGFGILLAFTPCILPMIPILSGIIVGQGKNMNVSRAFLLSLVYVLASAMMYTVFGVLAGLFGSNLQAIFQEPWIIISFSMVFVLLAFSMFGFYELQLPSIIQTPILSLSNRQRGGTFIGVAIMGALSALIVGPCLAAPLAGALIYIGQSGDALLGGMALFSLGLGMGIPLVVMGAFAGKILPKVGPWMNTIKSIFGVAFIAVAIWLLERILPIAATMFLWALLLIISAIYIGATDTLAEKASGWTRLWKGWGIIMLTYGILLLVGVASGSHDVFQPLQRLAGSVAAGDQESIRFQPVKSVQEFDNALDKASPRGQWVMLDFYADWCISCKEMEYYTFSQPEVQAVLANMVILQADVTQNSDQDKALLRKFGLIGPPAILFFGPDEQERKAYRVVGYKKASEFLQHVKRLLQT